MRRIPFVERFGHNMTTGECNLCEREEPCTCPPGPDGGQLCRCTCGGCIPAYVCVVCHRDTGYGNGACRYCEVNGE